MSRFFRKLMVVLLACALGWLASWGLAAWLAPRPVFEVAINSREQAVFEYETLSIYKDDKHDRAYRVTDGALLDVKNFRKAADIRHPLEGTQTPAPQGYYLEEFRSSKTGESLSMLFDSQTGDAYRFHTEPPEGHPAYDRIDTDVNIQRPLRVCFMIREFPPPCLSGLQLSAH